MRDKNYDILKGKYLKFNENQILLNIQILDN